MSKPSDEILQRVRINELELDKECIRLPGHLLQAMYQSAEAKKEVDRCSAELEMLKARIAYKIRKSPERYGLDKITETALGELLQKGETVREAAVLVREAKYAQDQAQALVWALEAKKRSLTLMVELHGMGYFSAPKLSAAGRNAVETMTKQGVRPRHRHSDEE